MSETNALNESVILSKPTLLYLDEVQTLNDFIDHSEKAIITSFLNQYHNLESKKGFILLLGGLSHTEQILQDFGISWFNNQSVHSLQRLERKDEENIFQYWLQKEIKTPSDPQEWIERISQQTEQWPSHIQSYCNAIEAYLESQESLSIKRLKQVLDFGQDLNNNVVVVLILE